MTVSNDKEALSTEITKSIISLYDAKMFLKRVQITKDRLLDIRQTLELIKPVNVELIVQSASNLVRTECKVDNFLRVVSLQNFQTILDILQLYLQKIFQSSTPF
jgi:hypothetical protein